MSRVTEVQFADVAQACQRLFAAGENVTFNRVYALLGNKGSGKVVNGYIRRWREEAGSMLAVRAQRSLPGVPDDVVATLDSTVTSLWQAALSQAEEAYIAARDALELDRAEWLLRLEAAAATEADLRATQATLEERTKAYADLQSLTQERETALREREAQVSSLREEIARLTALLESEQRNHADALAQVAQRADERLAEAQQRHQTELDQAAERADGERQHYASVTDQLRQSALAEKAILTEQLAGMKAMVDALRGKASRADNDASHWRGKAEAAEARALAAEATLNRITTRRKPHAPGLARQSA